MKTSIITSILLAILLIWGAYYLAQGTPSENVNVPGKANIVSEVVKVDENGNQVITLVAKRGYTPRSVTAKAGVPTILKITGSGSFDCSAFVVIPSLGFQGNLTSGKSIEVPIPAQNSGSVIRGSCAMGMYGFSLKFE